MTNHNITSFVEVTWGRGLDKLKESQNAMIESQVVMEAGEGRAGVERDPQPVGHALGGRRVEP